MDFCGRLDLGFYQYIGDPFEYLMSMLFDCFVLNVLNVAL